MAGMLEFTLLGEKSDRGKFLNHISRSVQGISQSLDSKTTSMRYGTADSRMLMVQGFFPFGSRS